MLKAIIFDMDGVLVDSEPLHYEVNKITMMEKFQIDLNYEYYKQYIGTTVKAMWEKIIKDFCIEGYTPTELFDLSEVVKARLVDEKGYPEVPGVVDFVRMLSKKYKLAVASSSSIVNIEKNVNKLGIKDEFSALVSGLTVANPKPFPDVFLKAASELGVEPSECLVVEDSGNGTKAAKAAGMACIGFINPGSGDQDLSAADYLFEDFSSIDDGFVEMVYSHHFGEP
ncbi:MAG: HAD family phosphatase [Lachnospiraceae bacterium]|nr:HAD family phosphatase [Lachnospiraceae bacterium]